MVENCKIFNKAGSKDYYKSSIGPLLAALGYRLRLVVASFYLFIG